MSGTSVGPRPSAVTPLHRNARPVIPVIAPCPVQLSVSLLKKAAGEFFFDFASEGEVDALVAALRREFPADPFQDPSFVRADKSTFYYRVDLSRLPPDVRTFANGFVAGLDFRCGPRR